MKRLALLLAGCATAAPTSSPDAPTSLHAALPARLAITGGTGAITAKRYGADPARVALPITGGAIAIDDSAITGFQLQLAPIALDDTAALADIALTLRAPANTTLAWRDDDAATAHATLDVALAWSLSVDGSDLPLNGDALTLPVELALSGDGESVDAQLSIVAPGALWRWASLLELDDLALALNASNQPDPPEDLH